MLHGVHSDTLVDGKEQNNFPKGNDILIKDKSCDKQSKRIILIQYWRVGEIVHVGWWYPENNSKALRARSWEKKIGYEKEIKQKEEVWDSETRWLDW